MNDKNRITFGLIVFIAIVTFPFWYNLGKASSAPELKLSEKAKAAKECVKPKEIMRQEHMQILDLWRDTVVRDANRAYKSGSGKTFGMSLSSGEESCLGCHESKTEFCDKCHNYASVAPYCWTCHIAPEEKKPEENKPEENK
ncbi:MAG: sulfate reduction electron transfer complex DsrMKJOP subunit DsrJ [Proteobacteria bacterium]|nr:menaquinol oxidoreductase [Desulfobacteraceae bacterium]MBU3980624.1 sulfate reduction electron transfer complex DsrMKJOP subunit DsrJ [Pseudomonadota bacterium]MBU4013429.1 sulfate reduction electron transfer complex DsrMKJOP subunit DsrJ [Pseudomonadota bacterium]MBU4068737.1 sulfate reduction electron transfer complex DsrMKJOP subunit DsrJ [Pseudomonadota bacterium]MBU4100203.1 sulfate reduction electron transfer complex DsrMKJOP subunit DsrJ [Pseudomonadota bacterium]